MTFHMSITARINGRMELWLERIRRPERMTTYYASTTTRMKGRTKPWTKMHKENRVENGV